MNLEQMKKAVTDAGYKIIPPPTLRQELFDLSGLSMRQVEEKTGVGASRLCRWASGKLELRTEHVENVTRILIDAMRERRRRMSALMGDREAVAI